MIIAVVTCNLSNCKFEPEKNFQGVNRIRSHGFCVSASVLYQLSYEDPDVGADQLIEFIFTCDKNDTRKVVDLNCRNKGEKEM